MGSELGWGASLPCAQSHGKNKFYAERDDPNRILESGNYQRIPIMFGANSYDGTLFYDGNHHILLMIHDILNNQ